LYQKFEITLELKIAGIYQFLIELNVKSYRVRGIWTAHLRQNTGN